MPSETKVTCDHCAKDLTSTGATPAYRLCLYSEALPHAGDFIHAVMVYPPVPRPVYFCGLDCLRNWLKGDV